MKKSIYFIGVGGIGVSALAKYYLEDGYQVFGSDLVASEITDSLRKAGAEIFIINSKFKSQNSKLKLKIQNLIKKVDLVIYSPAVSKNHPDLRLARKLKIKCQSYPQALGELTKKYFTIAVAGTHGKSTTTAMIGILLTRAGLDPTVIVGTKIKEFDDSNCRVGKSKYLVIEADEHFASFLNYWPKIIVLTTIEADHLDYYKNLRNIISAFKKFVSHLPKDGFLIANRDDKKIHNTFFTIVENVLWYSLKDEESEKLRKILKVPGEHNVSNALAALKVAQLLKIPDKIAFKALAEYRGAWRRFEEKNLKIEKGNLKIILDYAHHPTELKVTLKAAREKYPNKKIWCLFQPHQYQRTFYLFNDFIKIFKKILEKKWADKLFITDIFDVPGRESEEIKRKVNAQELIKRVGLKNINYIAKNETANWIKENFKKIDILMIIGAGDIYNLTTKIN